MLFTITLCRIDYAALLQVVSPNAGRMAGLLPQSALGSMAVQAINAADGYLARRLEQLTAEKGLRLSLESLRAKSLGEDQMQLTVRIDRMDMAGLAELLLPAAQRTLWRSDRLAFLGDALGREPDAYTQGLQTIWDALSDQEQERLLSQALRAYQAPLTQALNRIAQEKGLAMEVQSLRCGGAED